MVGAEVTHGQITVGGAFDAAAAEETVGVAIDQQREHHVGRVLLVAAALVVDGEAAERQPLEGADDEMDQVILGDPIAEVRGQKHGGAAVEVLKTVSHDARIDSARPVTVQFHEIFPRKKSDRLLACQLALARAQ